MEDVGRRGAAGSPLKDGRYPSKGRGYRTPIEKAEIYEIVRVRLFKGG
jgi:hypothetical protein